MRKVKLIVVLPVVVDLIGISVKVKCTTITSEQVLGLISIPSLRCGCFEHPSHIIF